jgi:hypothetical protein
LPHAVNLKDLESTEVPPNKACTGRLGLCAFFEVGSERYQFPVSQVGSPQPPVTQAVGRQIAGYGFSKVG